MPDTSVALSARLPAEDAEFLNRWQVEGAATPSEKLRKVVKETRGRVHAATDYRGALRMAHDLLAPSFDYVREAEIETGGHSELLVRMSEWLPELLAYVYSAEGLAGPDAESNLRRLEGGIAMRVLTMMQTTLQMAVTREGPFYDPPLLTERIQGVLDTAEVVADAHRRARG